MNRPRWSPRRLEPPSTVSRVPLRPDLQTIVLGLGCEEVEPVVTEERSGLGIGASVKLIQDRKRGEDEGSRWRDERGARGEESATDTDTKSEGRQSAPS